MISTNNWHAGAGAGGPRPLQSGARLADVNCCHISHFMQILPSWYYTKNFSALYLGILLYCDRRHHMSKYISIDIVISILHIWILKYLEYALLQSAVHCAHCIKSSPLSPVHCSVVCQVARSIIEAGLETQSRTQAEFRDLGVLMTNTMRNMTPAWTRATCHVTSSCDWTLATEGDPDTVFVSLCRNFCPECFL